MQKIIGAFCIYLIHVFFNAVLADCFFTLKAWNAQNGGAAAILVADDKFEPLITMDNPEEENADADYLQKITIPSALISKSLGDSIRKALSDKEMVNIKLDWTEALPHPDERVEYELWTNSNDECGPKCDSQIEFAKSFKGAAQILERKGYTQFTPHYITWYCPEAFLVSKQCKSQCINHGRYCAPDPEQDFSRGYDGKDVVIQNLRQACFFKVTNESGKPWLWWDYVTDFAIRCPMKLKKYNEDCANNVIQSLGRSWLNLVYQMHQLSIVYTFLRLYCFFFFFTILQHFQKFIPSNCYLFLHSYFCDIFVFNVKGLL